MILLPQRSSSAHLSWPTSLTPGEHTEGGDRSLPNTMYHKCFSCPLIHHQPVVSVSPNLDPLHEQNAPPAVVHVQPDPRSAYSLTAPSPFCSSSASSEQQHQPAIHPLPIAAVVRARARPGRQASYVSQPARGCFHRHSTGYAGVTRLQSCPLGSPARRTSCALGSSPKQGPDEPTWLHHLRTTRTPVPWEDLPQAMAAASHEAVQDTILSDLPLDVQQDIKDREAKARAEREHSLGARIIRVLSRLSLTGSTGNGATSQQHSPAARHMVHPSHHSVGMGSRAASGCDVSRSSTSSYPEGSNKGSTSTLPLLGGDDPGATGAAASMGSPFLWPMLGTSPGSQGAGLPSSPRAAWDILLQRMVGKQGSQQSLHGEDSGGCELLNSRSNSLSTVFEQPHMMAASAYL